MNFPLAKHPACHHNLLSVGGMVRRESLRRVFGSFDLMKHPDALFPLTTQPRLIPGAA